MRRENGFKYRRKVSWIFLDKYNCVLLKQLLNNSILTKFIKKTANRLDWQCHRKRAKSD